MIFLNQAGIELSVSLDKRAETILLDLQSGTIDNFVNGTLGLTNLVPIIGITSVTGGTISSVNYYDGTITLSGSTPTTITFL